MAYLLHYITGPRLFGFMNPNLHQVNNYSPNIFEAVPNFTISSAKLCMGVFKWTVLFWMPFAYRRYKSVDGLFSVGKFMCCLATGYWALFVIRGFGRFMNPIYSDFLLILQRAQRSPSTENMEQLSRYYFEFSHWPVGYDASSHRSNRLQKTTPKRTENLNFVFRPICYLLAHTIGVRMAFPGCTGIINMLVENQRIERLIQMTRMHSIKRVKLKTIDRNEIEAFYKDNRHCHHPNGKILVICCEGNAGFAELGNPKIPMEKNYSVLGWNHPGFGGSTGLPFPREEHNAIDAVMKYAIDELKFDVSEIIVFGWSIGGYTASWAAMNYPEIRGLILDATFDNIDKLAEKSMPMILYPLVLATVHEYLDLDVGAQLTTYNGPVRFIIRGQDEIIASEQGVKNTNRGYFLLADVLKRRYPDLITKDSLKSLWAYFGSTKYAARIMLERTIDPKLSEDVIRTIVRPNGTGRINYPLVFPGNMTESAKTKILLYIASKYTDEFDGTHCTELSGEYFKEGWSENELLD